VYAADRSVDRVCRDLVALEAPRALAAVSASPPAGLYCVSPPFFRTRSLGGQIIWCTAGNLTEWVVPGHQIHAKALGVIGGSTTYPPRLLIE
jgi:hypothetical protein